MRVLLVNPPYPVVESLTMPLGLLYLAARLEQGGHEVFLEDLWTKYCWQMRETYISMLFGYKKPMRKLRKLILPLLHSKEERQRALLLVQCETHQEILNTIFKEERQDR